MIFFLWGTLTLQYVKGYYDVRGDQSVNPRWQSSAEISSAE